MALGLRRDLHVGPPTLARVDGRDRVTAVVAGTPVFFESADAPVAASVEAFAGPFVLAALEAGVRLRFAEPPSATWRRNMDALVDLYRRWWGYRGPDPFAGVDARPDAGPPRAVGGQCFSGGIDSFYTLLHSPTPRDVLVTLHGFDVPLADETRMAAFEPSLRAVAATTGRRAVLLRTSIRRHPRLRRLDWDRAHGAVLAAAGHVLTGTIGTLVIAPSWNRVWREGWGSHWDSDPLWSSDRLTVVHDDPTLERWDKVPRVADHPSFFAHLRVCWEHRTPTGNCGECEKCIRTRVVFARYGVLARGERCFATTRSLAASIDALPALSRKQLEKVWEPVYLRWPLPADVAVAAARLAARSRRALDVGPLARIARRVRRTARRLRRLGRPRPR